MKNPLESLSHRTREKTAMASTFTIYIHMTNDSLLPTSS